MEFNNVPFNENEAVATAKALLAATDYAMLSDVHIENVPEFETYRKTLREIMKNPKLPIFFSPIPQPVWSGG